jgi:hypothetical protein
MKKKTRTELEDELNEALFALQLMVQITCDDDGDGNYTSLSSECDPAFDVLLHHGIAIPPIVDKTVIHLVDEIAVEDL